MSDVPDLWVVIPNWDKFQHYGNDRNTPWIKDYTEQLHRDEYLSLAPTARALLHGLRLMYARDAHQVRTTYVRGALQMRAKREHWDSLIEAGLIELSASKPARPPAHDRPPPRGERERERELPPTPLTEGGLKNGSEPPPPRAARGARANHRGDDQPPRPKTAADVARQHRLWLRSPAFDPETMTVDTAADELAQIERRMNAKVSDGTRRQLLDEAAAHLVTPAKAFVGEEPA